MKKLKLDVEHLNVESFETSTADAQSRGTVHGASIQTVNCTVALFTDWLSCWDMSCAEINTCIVPPAEQ